MLVFFLVLLSSFFCYCWVFFFSFKKKYQDTRGVLLTRVGWEDTGAAPGLQG